MQAHRLSAGFTLIELIVVFAIVALLLTIAAPRYIDHVERSRETTLRASLKVMREAVDKYEGDTGRLPANLEELVARRYLREVPLDPINERRDSWVLLAPADLPARQDAPGPRGSGPLDAPAVSGSGIADVRSGADGVGRDGLPYREW